MAVKFDHVAWRARYTKPPQAKTYTDALLAAKNLNFFHERDFPERHAHLKKTGMLLKPLDKATQRREKLFQEKFRGLMNERSTLPKETLTAKYAEHLPKIIELNKNPTLLKKFNTLPLPDLDYQIIALIGYAVDPATRAAMLQTMIDDAIKNNNPTLLDQCIAAGIDGRINEPLNTFTDKMTPKDHLKFLKNKTQFADKTELKTDAVLLTQFKELAAKTAALPKKTERNTLYKGMAAIHPDPKIAKTLQKKIENVAAPRKKRAPSDTPITRANALMKTATLNNDAFVAAYDVVVNLNPSATKTKNLFRLRDASNDDQIRLHLHETAIQEASFKDLIADTVAINTTRKEIHKADKFASAGDLYYLFVASEKEIVARKKTWTQDDQRLFEQNRDALSKFVFEGSRPSITKKKLS